MLSSIQVQINALRSSASIGRVFPVNSLKRVRHSNGVSQSDGK